MWKATLFALLTLAAAVGAKDLKYSDLKEFSAGLDLSLSYKVDGVEDFTPYNDGKACPVDGEDCQTPEFGSENNSVLKVEYTPIAKLPTLEDFDGEALGAPTKIQFKACYAAEWTSDRKWRKAKDVISKDKRCGKKMTTVDFDTQSGSAEFVVPTDTPTAQWFILALLKCPKGETGDLEVCGYSTTGMGEKFLESTKGDEIYYKTKVIDSRTAGLYIAVVVCSVASVSLLVGFFVYEQMTKKNK